ncbi:MAG: alpha/beta hydrolase family protein [Nodosilinea sp.]
MRPIEILLSVANVLTLLVLVLLWLQAARWTGYVTLIALLIAAAQVLIEGSRWQMIPAYLLTGLFFLLWLLHNISLTVSFAPRKLFIGLVGLGVFTLTLSIALPIILPVFRFPPPSGTYQIGTLTYHWLDANRQEIFSADPHDRRELMVQIWYPTRGGSASPRAPYMQHPEALASALRLLHLPEFIFGHFQYVTTHAIPSAPLADEDFSYPVLIFLSGRAGYRQSNTFQIEELVSHGYIVAGIDQPYAAAGVVFPDGRLVSMDPRMYDPARIGHPAFLDGVIPFLAQDVSFTLEQLASLNQSDPNGILSGRLNLKRAGILGVSLGGILSGEACLHELRLRACLVMDAFMSTQVVHSGLQQPTMWISRDAQTMQLERWSQVDIDETQSSMRAVYESLPGEGYLVLVPGIFHLDFTDAPLFSPLASLLGLSGRLDTQRTHSIINAYSLAFFDRQLKNRPAKLLDGPAKDYPEVLFETRRS